MSFFLGSVPPSSARYQGRNTLCYQEHLMQQPRERCGGSIIMLLWHICFQSASVPPGSPCLPESLRPRGDTLQNSPPCNTHEAGRRTKSYRGVCGRVEAGIPQLPRPPGTLTLLRLRPKKRTHERYRAARSSTRGSAPPPPCFRRGHCAGPAPPPAWTRGRMRMAAAGAGLRAAGLWAAGPPPPASCGASTPWDSW